MPEPTEVQESPVNASAEVGFEEYSKARTEGKVVDDGGEDVKPASDGTTRDSQGRFAKVTEHLAKQRQAADYVRDIRDGVIPPDDSMDGDTWLQARTAQIRNGTNRISVPDFPQPETAKPEAANVEQAAEQLTPEEVKHFQNHDAFLSRTAASLVTDKEVREAVDGISKTIQSGVQPQVIGYLGHILADVDNSREVLIELGKNPDVLPRLAKIPPERMRQAILEVSRTIAERQEAKKPTTKAPPPPDPVGARQVQSAFDVNDEKIPNEEWAKKRLEQRRKAGHAF